MGIQSISFKSGPPRSGNGYALPEQSVVPGVRGRSKLSRKDIQQLDSALEMLSDTPCSFWACEGPSKPRHMKTCGKCWAMREIAAVRATLANVIRIN